MIKKFILISALSIIFFSKCYVFASLSQAVEEIPLTLKNIVPDESSSSDWDIDISDRKHIIKNNIISYVDKYVISTEDSKERKLQVVIKYMIPVVLGLTSGLPLISPASKAVHNLPVLSELVSTGTYITIGGVAAWLSRKAIRQFNSTSQEEEIIFHISYRNKISKIAFSSLAAILTSIPDVFAAYKYNNSTWFIIPSFMYSVVSKQLGFYEFTSIVLGNVECKKNSRLDNTVIEKIVNKQIIAKLLDNDTSDIEQIKTTAKEDIIKTIEDIESENLMFLNQEALRESYRKRILQGISLIFPIGNAIVTGLYAYEATGIIYPSPLFQTLSTTIILLPSVSLDSVLTTAAVGELYNITCDKIKKENNRSFLETFYPTASKLIIPLIAVPLSCCLASTSFYMVQDTIDNSIFKSTAYTIPIIISCSNILLGTYGLINLGLENLKEIIPMFSTVKQKIKLSISEKAGLISSFIFSYWAESQK